MPRTPVEIDGFARTEVPHGGTTRTVYRAGSGPGVIVISEMPGITPSVIAFARRVVDLGCSVALPHLFGEPGRDPHRSGRRSELADMATSFVPACVSREFGVLATRRTSPVMDWLRALGRDLHDRCGGPGIGVVGMCFTGGFALAMATDPRMLAPVLSQPSLPVGITRRTKGTIDISPSELDVVKGRCAAEGLRVLGLRFTGDRLVPAARFEFLARELGDAFVAIELDDEDANPDAVLPPHSVLTEHLVDEPDQPTRDALDRVLDLFRTKLLPAT